MNKLIAKIAARLGFQPTRTRNYQGAAISRLTNDWLSPVTSADQEIRSSLSRLRQRCRELERNNDYVRRFLAGLESNVLGHAGIGLQMKVEEGDGSGRPDTLANDLIEKAWREWGRSDACTVTGRMTWFDVQRLALRSTARDGDCIIRMIRGAEGFRLQLLEGDRLDINFNQETGGGNEVRMGVEIDRYGKPVAYHILSKHPADVSQVQAKRERIPAEQVIHPFVTDRIAQTRGTPWMVSAMTRLQMLGAYEEAELTSARVSASKMGFLIKERAEGYVGDTDEAGDTLMEISPGTIEELPMGTTFQSWNPDHPTGNYAGFVKSCLRGIAAGLGVSYNMIANDLEGVNYSSIRAGLLDEREYYKAVQRWYIDSLIAPVFSGWLETNILNGTINLPSAKMSKFNSPGVAHWMPRRWAWVDPLKDQQASVLAVENQFKSKRQVVAEMGSDYESVLREIKQDEELAEDVGLEKPSESV
jgi:lambda family phage portal protein